MRADGRYAFSTVLYCSSSSFPPSRLGPEVERLCAIKTTLDISSDRYRGEDPNNRYKRVDYTVEMTVHGTVLEFVIVHNNRRYPLKHVEVEFENGPKSKPKDAGLRHQHSTGQIAGSSEDASQYGYGPMSSTIGAAANPLPTLNTGAGQWPSSSAPYSAYSPSPQPSPSQPYVYPYSPDSIGRRPTYMSFSTTASTASSEVSTSASTSSDATIRPVRSHELQPQPRWPGVHPPLRHGHTDP
jgi:hypothetical protein